MKIYGVNLSPFYERAMMLLDHKGQMDIVEPSGVPGGNMKTPEHFAMNPFGKIPMMELDDGTILLESQIIVEYLDSVSEGAAIVPDCPKARAKATLIARLVDMYLWPEMWAIINHYFWKRPDEAGVKRAVETGIPTALDALERYIGEGGFAVGNNWTYADFALTPVMFQFFGMMPLAGVHGFGDRPKLTKWWAAMQQQELMQRCHGRMQKSLEFIQSRS